jgi:triosephosphate isomerase (TIM)
MIRTPFVAGNWKLNLGPKEATALAVALGNALSQRGQVDVAVLPTALSIAAVVPRLQGTGIGVGVQEINVTNQGAFTGQNSATMAREAGCTYALVGHSERRQLFGETNANVGLKTRTALDAGLLPIVCVGETSAERRSGKVEEVIFAQLDAALCGLEPDLAATVTVAYEPVWAIGTGETATPDQAQAVHAAIRGWLHRAFPPFVGDEMRLQYGGSVKPHNARELLSCPDIDGCLVGGASLSADAFSGIVDAA